MPTWIEVASVIGAGRSTIQRLPMATWAVWSVGKACRELAIDHGCVPAMVGVVSGSVATWK